MDEYTVTINGIPHTMQLDPETAEQYGDKAVKAAKVKAHAPANKARTPGSKAES